MKFAELTESQQKRVFKEIAQEFMDNGERQVVAFECAKEYIEDIDGRFTLVDYSPDEDGTDIRVEW